MAEPTHDSGNPAPVTVDRAPQVYALDVQGGELLWVFALPQGDALIIDQSGAVMAHTSLSRIRARWARYHRARLAQVIEHRLGGTQVVEDQPVEDQPIENQPAENRVVENRAVENRIVDSGPQLRAA